MYLTQVLHRALQLNPQGDATRFLQRRRSFAEFGARVARLAAGLRALGLQDGDCVALLALNSDRYLEAQMAIAWAGGVMNPCNTRWSPPELAYAIDDSGTCVMIVDDAFVGMVDTLRAACPGVHLWVHAGELSPPAGMLGYEDLIRDHAPQPDRLRRGDDLAGIFYTGGTTGFPKGVMLTHRNLMSQALQVHAERLMQPGDVWLHSLPMFHLGDFGLSLAHWFHANTHAILPGFTPAGVVQAIARDRVSVLGLVPTAVQMLVDDPAVEDAAALNTLHTVVYGGSPMPEALLDRAMRRLPGVRFVQVYGMTETSAVVSMLHGPWHETAQRPTGRHRSAGRASYAAQLRVVDDGGAELVPGAVGEIVVRGANVMAGYWKRPRETAHALRDGWLHTGDAGYMDGDGFVFLVDRLKDMIISGGENIYSVEVENALGRHPAVALAAVFGVPHSTWGEAVHAVVVLRPSIEATADELIAHCRAAIAHYKCPRTIEFAKAVPISAAGKVQKARLREPHWAGHDHRPS